MCPSPSPDNSSYGIPEIVGIRQSCYSPYAAAIALWVSAATGSRDISREEILEAASNLSWNNLDRDYLEKFMARSGQDTEQVEEPPLMQKHMVNEAVVQTEAILRKFVLKETGTSPSEITEEFKSHPTYSAAVLGLEMLVPGMDSLNRTLLTSCPRCRLVGDIESWFGYRNVGGKAIPQSWCRICRTSGAQAMAAEDVLSLFNAESWFALSRWGKETGVLSGWERRFAYGMGRLLARNGEMSERQRGVAERLAAKALEAGFGP